MAYPKPSDIDDEATVRSFPKYQGAAVPGFVVNFLGTRTNPAFVSSLPAGGGIVEDYPVPGNFHATTLEWAGSLRAVQDCAGELVIVELGAGWAPWMVSLAFAAKIKGISAIHLVGVEGSKEHFDFMRAHLSDNQIDPASHTLLHGVVGVVDGVAKFPVLTDTTGDYGKAAVFPQKGFRKWVRRMQRQAREFLSGTRPPAAAMESVPCYSIETLLRPFERVDLVHIDIQGSELEVVVSAREILKSKVKRMVIGTHDRFIEQMLLNELPPQSWILEADEACQFRQNGRSALLERDGCQVWRNANPGFECPAKGK